MFKPTPHPKTNKQTKRASTGEKRRKELTSKRRGTDPGKKNQNRVAPKIKAEI